MQHQKQDGFTLLELSIVIVIIGLLTAGVLQGQVMIEQSKLTKMGKDIAQIRAAYETFILQYERPPGDLNKAESYWPSQTVNGNGDQMVQQPYSKIAAFGWETYHAFEMMSLADVYPGGYNASSYTAGDGYKPGVEGPKTPINSNSAYQIVSPDNSIYYGAWNADSYVTIEIGIYNYSFVNRSLLTPAQAQKLDIKIDDGNPSSGKLMASNGADNYTGSPITCTNHPNTSEDHLAARGSLKYNTDNKLVACKLVYVLHE